MFHCHSFVFAVHSSARCSAVPSREEVFPPQVCIFGSCRAFHHAWEVTDADSLEDHFLTEHSAPRFRERHNGCQCWFRADDSCGVTPPSGIFHQPGIPWAKPAHGAVSQTDFELARENNDVLPPRRRMPIDERAHWQLSKHNMCRGLWCRERWM